MDDNRYTLGIQSLGSRHFGKVNLLIDRFLPALGADLLRKVSLRIQKSDAHERQAHVARLFAVIAAKDSKSATVD